MTAQQLEQHVRQAAIAAGAHDPEAVVTKYNEAKAAGRKPDPTGFVAWLQREDPGEFMDATMAKILKGVPEMRSASMPGLAPMSFATPGGSVLGDWSAMNAGALRARGLTILGGTHEYARVSCMACCSDWTVPITKPLTAQQLLCPAGCNRASGLNW